MHDHATAAHVYLRRCARRSRRHDAILYATAAGIGIGTGILLFL